MRPFLLASSLAISLTALPSARSALAQDATPFLALALSDGPTPAHRLVLVARGSTAMDAVRTAYRGCFALASDGYRHTCQVGFGQAWVVGAICGVDDGSRPTLAIEADDGSPEAARDRAFRSLRDAAGEPNARCREVARYNASGLETARSIAKDKTQ